MDDSIFRPGKLRCGNRGWRKKEGYDGIVQLETRKHAYGLIPGMKTSSLRLSTLSRDE